MIDDDTFDPLDDTLMIHDDDKFDKFEDTFGDAFDTSLCTADKGKTQNTQQQTEHRVSFRIILIGLWA
jgi:hypothetical protein